MINPDKNSKPDVSLPVVDEYADLPFPTDFAGEKAHQLLLLTAMEATDPAIQEAIAARTVGDPVLWEDVMMNCRGNGELAKLLLDRQLYAKQLEDPAYNRTAKQTQLDSTNARIADIYNEMDNSV